MSNWMILLTGGGLVAAGGLVTGWLNNWMGSRRDQRARTHEVEMAAEARRQDRLERAYTELAIYLAWMMDWARSVHPFIGPVAAPDLIPPQERRKIEALVANHGSPENAWPWKITVRRCSRPSIASTTG